MIPSLPNDIVTKIFFHVWQYNIQEVQKEMYEGPVRGSGVGTFCTMFEVGKLTTWADYGAIYEVWSDLKDWYYTDLLKSYCADCFIKTAGGRRAYLEKQTWRYQRDDFMENNSDESDIESEVHP